ncbi:kinase-like domain-containing protein, partial [Lactarius quietus]
TFGAALRDYKKRTKKDIMSHPLISQFISCDSSGATLSLLRSKLTHWLEPTVVIFSPSIVIFAGIGVLFRAIKDIRGGQDALVDLFDRLEHLFKRLENHSKVRLSAAITNIFSKTIVELLTFLGIVTKEVGRSKHFLKKPEGRKDIEESLQRLDQVTAEVQIINGGAGDRVKVIDVNKKGEGADEAIDGNYKVRPVIESGRETGVAIQQVANHLDWKEINASAQSSSATVTASRSPAFPERSGSSDGDSAIAPSSSWRTNAKHKRTKPIEQAEGYSHTRSRVIEAVTGVLGTAASIGHEVLTTGVDLLQFAPVPGLNVAGTILLSIWDAVQMVESNRLASLRLTERCADILISVRGEIADAGDTIADELLAPIEKLVKAFGEVRGCLNKQGQRPFLKRYLGRDDILSSISDCDTALDDAREMFGLSIQIRTLKLVKATELQQKETHNLLESLTHVSPSVPSAALQSSPTDTENVRDALLALRAAQNARDRAYDMADLRQIMRTALASNDDVAMIEVLQIARSEMPEAIKTLEHAVEDDAAPDPGSTGARRTDTLDREFIVTGIDALRRLSKGADLGLPSWTITRFEVDLEEKVGIGFFSEVYRGTWRKHTVAVKVLAETTLRKIFLREVNIWKSLYHPNVLELFGASSASGEPPWFLVCKYYPQGNLVKYLKGLSDADAARIDAVKMIHEISKGMEYLHAQGVVHGDLKAANILVDDDTSCVISDFGQSEMKSEVYRITRTSQPRGTLRWQAPELMEGAETLTTAMDVYAFAICCWEILNMGALPWPLMDDNAVRHFVLNKDGRPSLSPSNLVSGHLMDVIRASWDRVPSKRPPFEKIARDLKSSGRGGAPIASTRRRFLIGNAA